MIYDISYSQEVSGDELIEGMMNNASDEDIDRTISLLSRICKLLKTDFQTLVILVPDGSSYIGDSSLEFECEEIQKVKDLHIKGITAALFSFNGIQFVVENFDGEAWLYFKNEDEKKFFENSFKEQCEDGEPLSESLLDGIQKDFDKARIKFKKQNPDLDMTLEDALRIYNTSSYADKNVYARPIYNPSEWEIMCQLARSNGDEEAVKKKMDIVGELDSVDDKPEQKEEEKPEPEEKEEQSNPTEEKEEKQQ